MGGREHKEDMEERRNEGLSNNLLEYYDWHFYSC